MHARFGAVCAGLEWSSSHARCVPAVVWSAKMAPPMRVGKVTSRATVEISCLHPGWRRARNWTQKCACLCWQGIISCYGRACFPSSVGTDGQPERAFPEELLDVPRRAPRLLHAVTWKRHAAGCPLRAVSRRPRAAKCKLKAASCVLSAASCKLPAARCKLQAASCPAAPSNAGQPSVGLPLLARPHRRCRSTPGG